MNAPALRERSCPLCGSDDAQPEVASAPSADTLSMDALEPFWFGIEKDRRFFTYHRCESCALLYNRTFFDDGQLGQLYAQMPPNMDVVATDSIDATQRGYFEALSRTELNGGYLEIGPDIGYVVREAATRGDFDHFWLFEPNQAVHTQLEAACGSRPSTISTSMHDLSIVPDGSVGVAVMVHVLDHILDPIAMLRSILRTLRPGGTLLIVTHNEGSLMAKLLKRRWPAFCLQHPELYNPETMQKLLAKAGYASSRVERSVNYFPIDFLAKQAAQAAGVRLNKVPLPSSSIGLRLGNIITLARAPG